MRSASLSPLIASWQAAQWLQAGVPGSMRRQVASQKEQEHEEVKTQLLVAQLQRMKNWLFHEQQLREQSALYTHLTEQSDDPFFQRRKEYLSHILAQGLVAIPAKVIFREPATWSTSLWVNVGQQDNERLGRTVVAVKSPVVLGKNVVGVVEEVTEKRSRVRLLTDPLLTPSVRVVRGAAQDRLLLEAIHRLVHLMRGREDLDQGKALEHPLGHQLAQLAAELPQDGRSHYLAKGEIHGCGGSMGRLRRSVLKGEGFNADFADAEGPARDLRTGRSVDGSDTQALIQVGDLLVTTGMDGIFPPDLHVGVVSKIFSLHEGGCSYSLEAEPLVDDFNELTEVFILPPL